MKKSFLPINASKKERRAFINDQKAETERLRVNFLLELIPSEVLEEISTVLKVDKWTKKLKAASLFKLLIFSSLQRDILSLRTVSEDLKDPVLQAFLSDEVIVEVGHSGIRDRLQEVNVSFFEQIFELVYEKTSALYSPQILENEYSIKRYDSTLVPVFAHHVSGMRVGNTKKNKTHLKFTTELCGELLPKMLFFKDQAHLSEETALSEIVLAQKHRSDEISIIDAGLKSRETFATFDKKDINFICRLTKNPRFKKLGIFKHKATQEVEDITLVQDILVQLYTSGASKPLNHTFRLVEYRVNKTGEIISWVTNVLTLPPQTIAQLYRKRWDIEVFFRFIKQELDFEHFLSYNDNAIKVQVYLKLIVAMFILIFKKHNNIKSFQKAKSLFFKELLYTLLLDILDDQDAALWFKDILKANFVQKRE